MALGNDVIARIGTGTITTTKGTLFNEESGAVIKTIIISNSLESEVTLTLTLDNVDIVKKIPSKDFIIIDNVIVVNKIEGIITCDDSTITEPYINYHISGILLGTN